MVAVGAFCELNYQGFILRIFNTLVLKKLVPGSKVLHLSRPEKS